MWIFLCPNNLNRVAKRTPTEQGGKGGRDAAGSERSRLEGAGRRPASERPVQVRELALFFCDAVGYGGTPKAATAAEFALQM